MNSTISRDGQIKAMESTVVQAEKYLGQFCALLASYTRKTAKLRDKADQLAAQLGDFANTEDPELRVTLKNLAEDLAMVQDYRQAQVERLETRVVTPLKAYGDIVKSKRADLKRLGADRSRELKELQRLEKLRRKNPADRQAEVSAQKAANNAHRSTKQLEDSVTEFQRQKLEDIKRIFTDFITVEMLFHAKALEVYTHTFQNLRSMDIDKDMELFTGRIRVFDGPLDSQALLTARSTSTSLHASPALGRTLGSTLGGTTLRHTAAGPARRSRASTLQRQSGVEEEEEDDEEEDGEEEMYESEMEEAQRTAKQSYAAQYTQIRRQQSRK